MHRLDDMGLVSLVFRTLNVRGLTIANVLFVELHPEQVRAVTYEVDMSLGKVGPLSRKNGIPLSPKEDTNTEMVPEILPGEGSSASVEAVHSDVPESFPEWLALIQESKNRQAVLVRMVKALYPGADVPAFSYMAKVAREAGGAGRLADLLWTTSAHPPTGDILAYIQGRVKRERSGNGNGKRQQAPEHTAMEFYEASQNTIQGKRVRARLEAGGT